MELNSFGMELTSLRLVESPAVIIHSRTSESSGRIIDDAKLTSIWIGFRRFRIIWTQITRIIGHEVHECLNSDYTNNRTRITRINEHGLHG